MNFNKKIILDDKVISKNTRPFILAEMACAHDGSIERAIEMVNSAADAGVDGIQFQLFSTDQLLTPDHSFYKRVKDLEISLESWPEIVFAAKKRGLAVFANALEPGGLEVAISSGAQVLKIHSADIANPVMLDLVAQAGLPVSLSTGGSTIEEIYFAINRLSTLGVENLILMHGYQGFPTSLKDSHLNYIRTLEQLFGALVGYQDHVDGESEMAKILPLLAMTKGAILLEKHITDNRSRCGTDYESALEKNDFKNFVDLVGKSWDAFGTSTIKSLSDPELLYRKNFKKSIVAARDIKKDEVLTKEMFFYMRGEIGYAPSDVEKIVGKRCARSINRYETIQSDHLR